MARFWVSGGCLDLIVLQQGCCAAGLQAQQQPPKGAAAADLLHPWNRAAGRSRLLQRASEEGERSYGASGSRRFSCTPIAVQPQPNDGDDARPRTRQLELVSGAEQDRRPPLGQRQPQGKHHAAGGASHIPSSRYWLGKTTTMRTHARGRRQEACRRGRAGARPRIRWMVEICQCPPVGLGIPRGRSAQRRGLS